MAYLIVGLPVIKEAVKAIGKKQIFTEFFLMSIATIGAIAIGEYPEAVAVMLFYTFGEILQSNALRKAKRSISALLDIRPKIAHVARSNTYVTVSPEEVNIGDMIRVKVGESIPLDGILHSASAQLNTAAITGESNVQHFDRGHNLMAGSINLSNVLEIEVTKSYKDSSISRILDMVQNANSKKAKSELLIRKLAKIYTPIVFYLAVALCLVPMIFLDQYVFSDWLYRALVFLVISCPCALVISIPLGYFGGLGAASRNGILFKGSNYIDQITKINTLVLDKTGTVTTGKFGIKYIDAINGYSDQNIMAYIQSIESQSNHPLAQALLDYSVDHPLPQAQDVEEWSGRGLSGRVNGDEVVVGNENLLSMKGITLPQNLNPLSGTAIYIAIKDEYAGRVILADQVKEDAEAAILGIKNLGISEIYMLSGDKDSITQGIAKELNIPYAQGDLLPEDKLAYVEDLTYQQDRITAFMGDGINDAPVLAACDIGIAMGGMGSDIAIETADVILQNDQPSKLITAIKIARSTQRIIWQNIYLVFAVKILVLILGAIGYASMWEAVFADVGLALVAIANAIRLQKMNWDGTNS
ncbi:heavy metal translocating P-type ATPase [Membranihabitans marinus]